MISSNQEEGGPSYDNNNKVSQQLKQEVGRLTVKYRACENELFLLKQENEKLKQNNKVYKRI